MKYRNCLSVLVLLFLPVLLFAQEIIKPNYGLKYPETVEIIRIKMSDTDITIDLSLQNQIEGGYFCIDENTFIEAKGKDFKIQDITGLPVCPDTYKFRSVGEKVYFSLKFDDIPSGVKWFDIVEHCDGNCFSVLGLNLDEKINNEINEAFSALDRLDPEEAIRIFEDMLPGLKSSGHGLTGSVYLNLIELFSANNRNDELKTLLSDFRSSTMPHKERYLSIIRNMGY